MFARAVLAAHEDTPVPLRTQQDIALLLVHE